MCKFFSLVTEPEQHGGQRFYFNWEYRKVHLKCNNADSHSHICEVNGLDEDKCNKYEYNPLTRDFKIDATNSETSDRVQVEEWLHGLDFKKIVSPLIIKEIINPFRMPKIEQVTEEHIQWLHDWASVWASVGYSVGDSVRDSVGDSVGDSVRDSVGYSVGYSVVDSVGDSVGYSVRASVGYSVWDSVRAYTSSFFSIPYKYDFSPCVRLWESGLVSTFDGKTWRLHSGEKAEIVYEWTPSEI